MYRILAASTVAISLTLVGCGGGSGSGDRSIEPITSDKAREAQFEKRINNQINVIASSQPNADVADANLTGTWLALSYEYEPFTLSNGTKSAYFEDFVETFSLTQNADNLISRACGQDYASDIFITRKDGKITGFNIGGDVPIVEIINNKIIKFETYSADGYFQIESWVKVDPQENMPVGTLTQENTTTDIACFEALIDVSGLDESGNLNSYHYIEAVDINDVIYEYGGTEFEGNSSGSPVYTVVNNKYQFTLDGIESIIELR